MISKVALADPTDDFFNRRLLARRLFRRFAMGQEFHSPTDILQQIREGNHALCAGVRKIGQPLSGEPAKFRGWHRLCEISRSSEAFFGAGPKYYENRKTTMSQKETSLQKLFEAQIKDIYYAEKQLVDAIPKMQDAAKDQDLAVAFADHLAETKQQVVRLERVFDLLDQKPKAEKCEAIKGLLKEAEEMMKDFKDEEALDAALIAAAQKVEHYEIATYGTLAAISDQLGLVEIGRALRETLREEKHADEKLSSLSNACNPVAAV